LCGIHRSEDACNHEAIIKNTYRTLMTRGQKGCYIYSVDPETNAYLKLAASRVASPNKKGRVAAYPEVNEDSSQMAAEDQ
jgi:hypothetical protein